MRQSTVEKLVVAAAMLSDEQKAAIADGEPVTIKLKKTAKPPFTTQVAFSKQTMKVTFTRKEE